MPASLQRLALSAFAVLAFDASATVVSSVAGGTLTATSDAADSIAISCTGAGGNVLVNGAIPGTGAAPCASIQAIVVQGGPGGNVLSLASVTAGTYTTLASATVSGGPGNDTISGSFVGETLNGDGDLDLVDGNGGNDTVALGDGGDTFVWNPGDGSDVVDGNAGTDLMQFDGSGGSEIFAITGAGARFMLTRNVGSIVMNVGTVEQVTVNALGLADTFTLNDTTGSGLAQVTVDLGVAAAGDAAADAITYNGSGGDDVLTATASGTQYVVSGGPAALTVTNVEAANDSLTINALGGNDAVTDANTRPIVSSLIIDGGTGNDTLTGGLGMHLFLGGDGDDTIAGGDGNDTALLGANNDTFTWNPGDDNDLVEGQAGQDRLAFNGSNASEVVDFTPNGGRFILFRNVAAVTMDLDDVERIDFAAFGGADVFNLNSPAGTDVSTINIALEATGGGGDAAADVANVLGTVLPEQFAVAGTPAAIQIVRSTSTVTLTGAEAANDRISITGLDGNDTLFASSALAGALAQIAFDGGVGIDTARAQGGAGSDTLLAQPNAVAGFDALAGGALLFNATTIENMQLEGFDGNDTIGMTGTLTGVQLTMDGGPGDDALNGGLGVQVQLGGDGNDTITGGDGNDFALMGADDDTFVWNPGDDNDVVEGQAGSDLLLFNGSNVGEIVTLSANGGRVLFQRNVATVVMDLDDVETVRFNAFGGADAVQVNDPTGTDLAAVEVDLNATLGGGDAATDLVSVFGTASNDVYAATLVRDGLALARVGIAVSIFGPEPALDVVVVNGLAGDDVLVGDAAAAATVQRIQYEGGGNSGLGDQLVVDGADVAESWTIAPNAARLNVSRASGGLFDANAIERLQLAANGGADNVSTQGLPAIAQILDGGAPASFPGDVLMVSGFAGDPSVSPILVPGAQPIAHANFEFGPTGGRVRGRTYDDLDRDGTSDAGEPALAGLTVFDDANGNRAADPGETSAVTAADGSYELAFADEGSTVDVRVVPPAGRVQTSLDPATIVLNGNTTVSNIDVGFTTGTLIEAFPTGWQETPPNASPGTGYGYAALYEPSNEVVFVLSYSGLGSANTLTHVHGPAARGVAASPIIDLPSSGATSGSLRVGPMVLTPTQVAQLKAGLWYYNVHTTTFPAGEIRGQLDNALFKDSFE